MIDPMIVRGTIEAQNLTQKNEFGCFSVKINGSYLDSGEQFNHFASTPERVNVFRDGDPNPIDAALVDGKKWNGSALVFPYTTSAGNEAWRFEALSFDLDAGPIIERVPQSHASNPFMAV